jgi:Zn-dependent peptidase ImmA (M78 family)/DNA-binding XRE family transcriptional regulator
MAKAPKVEALVKPELLRWGRETAGLSLEAAAKKIGVKPERLTSWESGDTRPSIPQLRKMAEVYKRPLAIFYLPAPPPPIERIRDFRRLPGSGLTEHSPELRFEIRSGLFRRSVALDLLDDLDEEPIQLETTATLDEDPEAVGARIRDLLGVDYGTQTAWRDDRDAFRYWRTALENVGVLVFLARRVPREEMLGFSISKWPLPVVVVNGKNQERGRIFTMLHEFAHLLLREGGICDINEEYRRLPETQRVEVFCNHAAGAALIPMDRLLREEGVEDAPPRMRFTDEQIIGLAQRYRASRETVLRRLLLAGKITNGFYLAKRKQYQQEFEEARSGGFAAPHTVALNTTGRLFARLVLESYEDERITASDLSTFLGIGVQHLPKVQEAMRSGVIEEPAAS